MTTTAPTAAAAVSTTSQGSRRGPIPRAADATHGGLLDEEHGADLSTRTIDDVVQAARSGTSTPPDRQAAALRRTT